MIQTNWVPHFHIVFDPCSNFLKLLISSKDSFLKFIQGIYTLGLKLLCWWLSHQPSTPFRSLKYCYIHFMLFKTLHIFGFFFSRLYEVMHIIFNLFFCPIDCVYKNRCNNWPITHPFVQTSYKVSIPILA